MKWFTGSPHRKFLAPVVAAVGVAAIALIPALSAGATPNLRPLTAKQLLVKAESAQVRAFSGSVQLTANLGLPNLSSIQSEANGGGQTSTSTGGFDPTSLLSGTHQLSVWVNGPSEQRLALPASLAETDLIHSGRSLWVWDSNNQRVRHLVAPAGTTARTAPSEQRALTPNQSAEQVLHALSPDSTLSVQSPRYVAGRAAYLLVLAPKAGSNATDSTITSVTVAIDAATGMPLQLTVNVKGQTAPALQLGFTSLSLAAPAASNFSFAPPSGAKVTTKTVHGFGTHASMTHTSSKPTVIGNGWGQVFMGMASNALTNPQLGSVTTPVSGAFGSGRLLHSSLFNVLFLGNGKVVGGAVTTSALEAAAAQR